MGPGVPVRHPPTCASLRVRQKFRRSEDHAIWRRVGSWRDHRLRRPGDTRQQLDTHQHREVLMHGVVAMLDIGTTIFAELHLELDLPTGTQPPNVLARQLFGCRDRGVSAIHRDPFLEMEVDRMIPAAAAVGIGPMLDLTRLRHQQTDAVGVHRVGLAAIDADDPGEVGGFGAVGNALTVALA